MKWNSRKWSISPRWPDSPRSQQVPLCQACAERKETRIPGTALRMRLQLLRATALQAPVSGPLCSLRRLPSPPTSRYGRYPPLVAMRKAWARTWGARSNYLLWRTRAYSCQCQLSAEPSPLSASIGQWQLPALSFHLTFLSFTLLPLRCHSLLCPPLSLSFPLLSFPFAVIPSTVPPLDCLQHSPPFSFGALDHPSSSRAPIPGAISQRYLWQYLWQYLQRELRKSLQEQHKGQRQDGRGRRRGI